MILRVLDALAWVSLFLAFIVFIISYASFPDEVLVYIKPSGEPVQYIERNLLFYSLLGLAVLFNGGMLAFAGILKRTSPELTTTITGVSYIRISFNFFFATAVYFINLLNSRENFDYSNFGYLIYVTGGLLIAALIYTTFARVLLKK